MRLCRFNEGRYGVVRRDIVDDVTEVVDRVIRRADNADNGVRGDPVVAHLADITAAIAEAHTRQASPRAEVRLLRPIAHPSKLIAAPTNYRAHIAEMAAHRSATNPHLPQDIGQAGLFLKANSALVGPSHGVALRFPER